MTGISFCDDVLTELGVYAAGETPTTADRTLVLTRANYLLDAWNAERDKVYADQILTETLTPSLNPHTIGPSTATWTSVRPVSIEAINLIGTSDARTPIWPRDAQWYQALSTPELTSDYPTDFWYNPSSPNGSIYFYPVPTAAYEVELWARVLLSALVLDTTAYTLPPGYDLALMLSTAELCCGNSFGIPLTPELQAKASKARARIAANNAPTLRLQTQDSGMPSGGRGWFDYQTGRVR